ncbi:proteolipid membrane potential modulator domain-containing protein [Ditylenchus destructor]|nr:proteolipid membrane potential modulator domain-containing protein [Ditylenchus destructor]
MTMLLNAALLGLVLLAGTSLGSVDNVETKNVESQVAGSDDLHIRAKRSGGNWSGRQIIELIFCIILPPVAVILHGGAGTAFILHIALNVVLCILGWIPGIIHAVWYCFFQ